MAEEEAVDDKQRTVVAGHSKEFFVWGALTEEEVVAAGRQKMKESGREGIAFTYVSHRKKYKFKIMGWIPWSAEYTEITITFR